MKFMNCKRLRFYTLAKQEKTLIHGAMFEIQRKSCVEFRLLESNDELNFDYVEIRKDRGGCFFQGIGRMGIGKQVNKRKRTKR